MAIPESFIEQLKSYNDLVTVMSSYVDLKRRGRGYVCLCPFHSERTPSCTVYPDNQSFFCFGCGAGGDVITFVRRIENLEYIEAVRFLAGRAGLTLPEDAGNDDLARLKAEVLEINREAARFYHGLLLSPAGERGMTYLLERGLSEKMITRYGLGFAPEDWSTLYRHLRKQGYTDEQQITAALAARGKKGTLYDQFRNRVIFPIIDLRGNVIGFGGRLLSGDGPKYLNSSDTVVFKKSRNLFSLNFAKGAKAAQAGGERRLILAEGYMDVIAIYQAGFHNVVATLGTALTKEQARLMSQYADDVIIAYDADQAGQTATHKAISLLGEAGVRARIIRMQGAKDPDEYIKTFGAARFKLLLDGAGSAIEFELSKAKAGLDLEEDVGKVEYLKRAVEVLADILSPLEREVYTGRIAQELQVSKEIVSLQVSALLKKRKRKDEQRELFPRGARVGDMARPDPDMLRYPKEAKAETGILAYLFQHPDALESILSRISAEDFVTEFHRKVFEAVVFKLQTNQKADISLLHGEFPNDEMGRIAGILAKFNDLPFSAGALDDYIDVLRAHKLKMATPDAAALSPEELRKLRDALKTDKS